MFITIINSKTLWLWNESCIFCFNCCRKFKKKIYL